MRTLILIIVIFIYSSVLLAGEESGGSAGSFLQWGVGARAIALGKAFTAIANDGSAIYWNPAGLAQLSTREFSAMHALIFEDRAQNFIQFTYPISPFSISAGWMRFGVNDIQERSTSGEFLGKFDDSENLFLLGSGYQVLSKPTFKLDVGLTAKYFYHSLQNYHASGYGIDLGVLSYFHLTGLVERIGIGATVQNLGAKLKWNTESNHEDNIPVAFRLGAAVHLKPVPFKIAADLEKNENQDLRIHAGAEYWIRMLALRAGINHDKFTGGAGLVLKLGSVGFILDYALTTDEIANDPLHFFTLIFRF